MAGEGGKNLRSTRGSRILRNPDENKEVKIQRGNCLIKMYGIHISHGNRVWMSNPTVSCGALIVQ